MKNIIIFILAIVFGILVILFTVQAVKFLIALSLLKSIISCLFALICWKICENCFDEL